MKILIIAGFVIPEAAKLVDEPITPFGGWVTSLINNLQEITDIEIAIAMKSSQNKFVSKQNNNTTYYYLPTHKKNKLDVNLDDCKKVIDSFKPNLIHAEGAEVYITNRFFKVFDGKKVVSTKGVFNDIIKNEYADLTNKSLLPRFLIYKLFLFYQKKIRFNRRKKIELETYQLANYVLGRTLYDKAFIKSYNPKINYYHLDETLRSDFYMEPLWSLENVEHFSIFVGNGFIARKGAHTVVKALAILKDNYPNIKLNIIIGQLGFFDKFLYKGYLVNLIKKLKLVKNINLLPSLNTLEIKNIMLKSHVYIQPSFVENSSNTLGEAMILGMPCIVSYCGGVSSMATDEKEALFYRPGDEVVLAHQIVRVFSNKLNVDKLSKKARGRANKMFDNEENIKRLKIFYTKLIYDEI